MTNWCRRAVAEGRQGQGSASRCLCKLIFGHLMDLVHGSVSQHTNVLQQHELEQLLTDVLKVMRTIFEIHPVGALDPPDEVRQGLAEARESHPTLRLFELNASYLMVVYGGVERDSSMLAHVLATLQHVKAGGAKCHVLAVHLIKALIKKVLDPLRPCGETVK